MKGWITLHIQCHNEDSSQLEELGIEVDYNDLPFEEHDVQISSISTMLQREDYTVLHLHGQACYCEETKEEIFELIRTNEKTTY